MSVDLLAPPRLAPAAAEPMLYPVCKRGADVILAGLLLVLLAPLMAVIALAVRLSDGGPALYVQRRVGLGGREFAFFKFRSMVPHAESLRAGLAAANVHGGDGVTFKVRRDPRVTFVGRLLRRTSLDELPQLWNVLLGDMSLVGPRPALPAEVARYTPAQRARLMVTPGITCYWQVYGRACLPFERQVELDLAYIHSRSLWLDLKLLLMTVPAVLSGHGAC